MAFLHRPLLRTAVRLGKTDESKTITVNVHLRRRPGHDPIPTFDDYLHGPPRVRLPEAEFAQRFGAADDDVAAVKAHFSQFGFTMSHHMAARRVYLTGTVAQHNEAFQVDLHDYTAPHVHAHAEAPYIPDHLSPVIMRLHGLHLVQLRPHILHPGNRPNTGGLNPPGYNVALLTPQIVAGCYQFPTGHTGAGQAIGIFINYGEAPGSMALVDQTCSNYGIAAPPTPVWISVDGSPPPTIDTGDGWTQENVLDVTMCAMFAPSAIVANIAIKNSDDYYVRLAHPHPGDPLFTVGSNSSGVSDEDVITQDATSGTIFSNYDDTYEDCAIQGVTLCNSSGDWGNSADPWNDPSSLNQAPAPNNVVAGYPGTNPYVLDVGGTSLGPAAGGTIPTPTSLVEWVNGNAATVVAGENLSTASGGGVSIIYPVPSYQLSANIPAGLNTSQNPSFFGSTAGRGVPDLCAIWGMLIAIGSGPGQGNADIGGTSMSCPVVASLIACVNSALGWNVGFINPILYSLNGNTSIIRRISPGGPPNNTVWSLNLQSPTAPVQIQNLPAYPTSSTAWSACGGLGVLLAQPFVNYLQSVKNVVTITGVTLSNSKISSTNFGTVVGSVSVQTTGGPFTGAVAIGGGVDETGTVYPPGPDGQWFTMDGNNLIVIGTSLLPVPVNQSSFQLNLVAIQTGAAASPFVAPKTITTTTAPIQLSITLAAPATCQANTSVAISGTLGNYTVAPVLQYQVDGGSWLAFPAGNQVTSTNFSFPLTFGTAGSHTLSVRDSSSTSVTATATVAVLNIVIQTIPSQFANTSFLVTAAIQGYTSVPVIQYNDDGGTTITPTLITATITSISFTHPGLSAGNHVIMLWDSSHPTFVYDSNTIPVSAPSNPTSNITIQSLSPVQTSQSFTVSGTYSVTPTFDYADDGGPLQVFPVGSLEPSTPVENWAFIHPGFAVSGTHTITVQDTVTAASASTSVAVFVSGAVSGTVPNQVGTLVLSSITNTSITATWPLNVTGPQPTGYELLYRTHGSGSFVSGIVYQESVDGSAIVSPTSTGSNPSTANFFDDFKVENIAWTAWNPNGGTGAMATPGNGSISLGGHTYTVTSGGIPEEDGSQMSNGSEVLGMWNVGGTIWIDCITDRWFSWNGSNFVSGNSPIGRAWLDHYPFGGNEYFLPAVDEQEYLCSSQAGYTSSTNFNPFSIVSGSVLAIRGESVTTSGDSNPAGQPWNAGNISSCTEVNAEPTAGLYAFQYGYVEINCQTPAGGPTNLNGPGFWPQFVLYPLSGQGPREIDIFEILGGSPTTIRQTIHSVSGTTLLSGTAAIDTGFHRVGVDWQASGITFYIDGIATAAQFATPGGEFAQPFYINCGLAVGGSNSWQGTPVNTDLVDPGYFLIDSIGVWANFQTAYSATGTIYDAQGNAWTLVYGGSGNAFQIAKNGVVDNTTRNVTILLYWAGGIYQQNTAGNWYGTPGNWVQIAGDPRQAAGGPVSPSGTFYTSTAGVIRDSGNNTYQLTGVNGQIKINGTIDGSTSNVTVLLTWKNNIYQENTSNNWYQYNGTPGNYTQIAGDPRKDTQAVTLLVPATAYDFEVYAFDAAGNGPASAVVSGTTNVTIASNGFTTNGATILDASGNSFLPKMCGLFEGYNANGYGIPALSVMNWQTMVQAIKALGYNTIRLGMFVQGILNGGWSASTQSVPPNYTLNPDLVNLNMLQIYDKIIAYCATLGGIYVVADIHSTNGAGQTTGFFSGQATITNPTTWTGDGVSNANYVNACAVLGTRWAGQTAWLGLEMMNEPTTTNFWWGVKTGLIDITAAYTAGANACHEAILAVNTAFPVPLILCSGINNTTATYMSGQATIYSNAAGYDLSGVTNKPITLISPNRVVYVVHPWPNNPTFPAAPEGSGAVNNYNTLFGYLVAGNIAPVFATAMGAGNMTTTPSAYPQQSTYAPFIVSYLSGTSGFAGAPTKPMGWCWWTGDAVATDSWDNYAIFNSFTNPLTFVNGCASFIQQLLGVTPSAATANFTISNQNVFAPNGSRWLCRGVDNYFIDQNGSGNVADHATISGVFPGINTFKACLLAHHTYADVSSYVTDWTGKGCVIIIANYIYGAQDPIESSNFPADAATYSSIAVGSIGNPFVWFETCNEPLNGSATVDQDHQNIYTAVRNLVSFTGTSTGTTSLTVSNVTAGASNPGGKIILGMTINPQSGIPLRTTIVSQSSGTVGGAGVYVMSNAIAAQSNASMTAGNGNIIVMAVYGGGAFYPVGSLPGNQANPAVYANMYNIIMDEHTYGTGNGIANTGSSDFTNSMGNYGNSSANSNNLPLKISGWGAWGTTLDGKVPVGSFEWGDAYAGSGGPHNFGTPGGGALENQVIACLRTVCNASMQAGMNGFAGNTAWEYGNYYGGTVPFNSGDVMQNNNAIYVQSDAYGQILAYQMANPMSQVPWPL